MKGFTPHLKYVLAAASMCIIAAVWAQEPTATSPTPVADKAEKTKEPDDKKKPDKDKEKDKKQPEVATETPFPMEPRPDSMPRTLPRAPEMLGDMPPLRVPSPISAALGGLPKQNGPIILPVTRGFKIADDSSPRPQDRVLYGFQYFDYLNGSANRANGADIGRVGLYRSHFGVEKSFLDGAASVEIRVPINTLSVSGNADLNGNRSSGGDLSIILRYALLRNEQLDNYLTVGLAVTAPTGPATVGNTDVPNVIHSTTLQPFVGYLWNRGDFFVQGFLAVDVPTDRRDVTLLFNDLGLGYFLFRTPDDSRFLTAVAPAFEVHITNPLNFRNNANVTGAAYADEVNLGMVGNFEFRNRARLSAGVVTPVTGPRPFSVEGIVQLRLLY